MRGLPGGASVTTVARSAMVVHGGGGGTWGGRRLLGRRPLGAREKKGCRSADTHTERERTSGNRGRVRAGHKGVWALRSQRVHSYFSVSVFINV
jgi:hypothetical protein